MIDTATYSFQHDVSTSHVRNTETNRIVESSIPTWTLPPIDMSSSSLIVSPFMLGLVAKTSFVVLEFP